MISLSTVVWRVKLSSLTGIDIVGPKQPELSRVFVAGILELDKELLELAAADEAICICVRCPETLRGWTHSVDILIKTDITVPMSWRRQHRARLAVKRTACSLVRADESAALLGCSLLSVVPECGILFFFSCFCLYCLPSFVSGTPSAVNSAAGR